MQSYSKGATQETTSGWPPGNTEVERQKPPSVHRLLQIIFLGASFLHISWCSISPHSRLHEAHHPRHLFASCCQSAPEGHQIPTATEDGIGQVICHVFCWLYGRKRRKSNVHGANISVLPVQIYLGFVIRRSVLVLTCRCLLMPEKLLKWRVPWLGGRWFLFVWETLSALFRKKKLQQCHVKTNFAFFSWFPCCTFNTADDPSLNLREHTQGQKRDGTRLPALDPNENVQLRTFKSKNISRPEPHPF